MASPNAPGNPVGAPVVGGNIQLPRPPDGDVNIGYRLEVAATTTFIAAAIVVALRFHARIKYARLGWDDYFMGFAVIQALVATIIDFVATDWGLGRHLYYLTLQQRVQQQYYSLLAQVFCIHALTFCKISISLTYVRILKGSWNKWLRYICHAISVGVFLVNTMVIIVFYAQCIPNRKAWDPSVPGTCYDRRFLIGFVLLQGSFSALTDLTLCVIPFWLLKDLLQVGRRSKAILLTLMGLGLVTAIFAIIRTNESSAGLRPSAPDVSYTSISGLTWAGMERNIAMMIGSIPQCRPLVVPIAAYASKTLSRFYSSRFSSSASRKSKGHSYAMDDRNRTDNPPDSRQQDHDPFVKQPDAHFTYEPSLGRPSAGPSHNSHENILPVEEHQAV